MLPGELAFVTPYLCYLASGICYTTFVATWELAFVTPQKCYLGCWPLLHHFLCYLGAGLCYTTWNATWILKVFRKCFYWFNDYLGLFFYFKYQNICRYSALTAKLPNTAKYGDAIFAYTRLVAARRGTSPHVAGTSHVMHFDACPCPFYLVSYQVGNIIAYFREKI